MAQNSVQPGEPAPLFTVRSTRNPRYAFESVGGYASVLCFVGTARDDAGRELLAEFQKVRAAFDDRSACFFAVTCDPEDETTGRVADSLPGVRTFWDFDGAVSRLYRTAAEQTVAPAYMSYARTTFVLDKRLRVFAVIALESSPAAHVAQVMAALAALRAADDAAPVPAPVLVVPRVFEPAFCQKLIRYYEDHGGNESGFMREVDGKTVGLYDHGIKRRKDCLIEDEALRKACVDRIVHNLVPEIARAFQFKANRIERYLVACYQAETGDHFRPHRDNTTGGTAHRRFAVSLVLNAGEFEGGRVRFPEFGPQTYAPPAGGAVVFSCSLLHEATPVTQGRRFVFLPFLYDDEAAKVRKAFLDRSARIGAAPAGS